MGKPNERIALDPQVEAVLKYLWDETDYVDGEDLRDDLQPRGSYEWIRLALNLLVLLDFARETADGICITPAGRNHIDQPVEVQRDKPVMDQPAKYPPGHPKAEVAA